MIRNQWYVVLESDQVRKTPLGVTRMGESLVFWRDGTGQVRCAVDRCPHRGAALSLGKVVAGNVQCPFHGFEYDRAGQCTLIPANGRAGQVPAAMRLAVYQTHEAHGFIWIWWGDKPPADLQPPVFFDNLDGPFYHASAHDPWDAHYSRVIENQLDVAHLPFVHYNTIGRGGRTLVDGPVVRWSGETMFCIYVFNRLDDGTPPRDPEELDIHRRKFHLEFIFPNLWQNYISDDVRVVAAFIPVDEGHTLLALRFYQKFLSVPVLGRWIAQLALPSNLYIAHQDRRVVVTQQPAISTLRTDELPIKADAPIIEYRRRREQLQKAAS
jgi:phenylpropionate dioxygenase-like ring-hydroxylating dioxygenase large terminal subunit